MIKTSSAIGTSSVILTQDLSGNGVLANVTDKYWPDLADIFIGSTLLATVARAVDTCGSADVLKKLQEMLQNAS
jgi:hypothetical protein